MLDTFIWAAVVLVSTVSLGTVFMFKFGVPITRLIDRTKEVSSTGWKGADDAPAQIPPPKDDDRLSLAAVNQIAQWDRPVMLREEELIKADLTAKGFTPAEREATLLRVLAGTRLLLHFEQTWTAIWGSQIALLYHLNNFTGGQGLRRQDAAQGYEEAKRQFPALHAVDDLDSYLRYLVDARLMVDTGGVLQITDIGREFLKYILEYRKPVARLVG